ncbi:hypothetical protein SmJEL517_g00836 [Synchytrium microbalum]|uniref:DH domain-containing protein n=1 Tax=Synchytrium microbalum TaxID=1806994 RepID=A0A507CGN1_9FUNG|nr:uncharacterized protein SmJEL517_g00836 [Synchytrium microbalum]TPX37206.1 hypothetical protein SmJEL517_g00836 [Synchytrium microbalum]
METYALGHFGGEGTMNDLLSSYPASDRELAVSFDDVNPSPTRRSISSASEGEPRTSESTYVGRNTNARKLSFESTGVNTDDEAPSIPPISIPSLGIDYGEDDQPISYRTFARYHVPVHSIVNEVASTVTEPPEVNSNEPPNVPPKDSPSRSLSFAPRQRPPILIRPLALDTRNLIDTKDEGSPSTTPSPSETPMSPNTLLRRQNAMTRRKRLQLQDVRVSKTPSPDLDASSNSGGETSPKTRVYSLMFEDFPHTISTHEPIPPSRLSRARTYSPGEAHIRIAPAFIPKHRTDNESSHDGDRQSISSSTTVVKRPTMPRRSTSLPIRPPVPLPRPPSSVFTTDSLPSEFGSDATWTRSSPTMYSTGSSTNLDSSSSSTNKNMSEEEYTAVKRAMARRELLDTERGYVHDLRHLVEYCFERLMFAPWLSWQDKAAIVKCGRPLLEVQKRFLDTLETAFKDSEDNETGEVAIAHVFITMAGQFGVYKQYCTEYDGTLQLLSKYANSVELMSFTQDFRMLAQTRLGLRDYLIKPVQRICKYPTLLSELIRLTPTTASEYNALILARVTMQSIAGEVDSTRRLIENTQRSERLLRRLGADASLFVPGFGEAEYPGENIGVMSKGGGCWVVTWEKEVPEIKYRGVFCFPKHLLIMKAKKANVYHLKSLLRLDQYELKRVSDREAIVPYSFRLQHIDLPMRVDFGASSERERSAWMSTLQNLCSASYLGIKATHHSPIFYRRRTRSNGTEEVPSSEGTDYEDDGIVIMERTPSSQSLASINNGSSERSSPLPPTPGSPAMYPTIDTGGVFGSTIMREPNRRFWRTGSVHLADAQQLAVFNRRASVDLKLSDVITTYAADSTASNNNNSNSNPNSPQHQYPPTPIPRTRSFGRINVHSMPDLKAFDDLPELLPITALAPIVEPPIISSHDQIDLPLVPPPKPIRIHSKSSTMSLRNDSTSSSNNNNSSASSLTRGEGLRRSNTFTRNSFIEAGSTSTIGFLRTMSMIAPRQQSSHATISEYDSSEDNSHGILRIRNFWRPHMRNNT